jgi:hypothetical protein
VYYSCVKFHKNSTSSVVGVALTRYMPPFRESISLIISPFKFWINMVAVQNLKGEIIKLILSRKGGMYLVSATPTTLLVEFL